MWGIPADSDTVAKHTVICHRLLPLACFDHFFEVTVPPKSAEQVEMESPSGYLVPMADSVFISPLSHDT